MNYLAHLYLSGPDVEFRLGNLLADHVRGEKRAALSPGVRRGVACHQAIDTFTDAHAQVAVSRRRVNGTHRHFAGVLVDVFYDHFLARDWDLYSPRQPLGEFIRDVYDSFYAYTGPLPDFAPRVFDRMVQQDWLGAYVEVDGVEVALKRITGRLRRPYPLDEGVAELRANYEGLSEDFRIFFPQLIDHVRVWKDGHAAPTS